MKKNTREVFAAWEDGKSNRACDAIWTDGKDIYSYATCLLTTDRYVILNETKYSPTTSRHQHGLRVLLADFPCQGIREVTGLDRGASPDKLRAKLHELSSSEAAA